MKPEERKEQILECTKKLFATKGYYQTQISDIIAEAKIARGTVYQYFANKEDIFVTLLEGFLTKWEESISIHHSEIDLTTISALDYFNFRLKKTLGFFENDPHLCQILLRMGLGLPGSLSDAIRKFEKRILHLLVNDLTFGINNKNVRPDIDVYLVATLISGAVQRAAYYYFGSDNNEAGPVDIDQLTRGITDVFGPGILLPGNGRNPLA